MPKKITVYTTTTCAYCVMVKKFLTIKGCKYEEVNLDKEPERRQEAQTLSGALTVPVTVVTKADGMKTVTIGYNPGSLTAAIA